MTTIISQTLAKDFAGWALACMEESLLHKLTESRVADTGLTWEDISDAKLEASRRRIHGSDTGTAVHAMIEKFLKGAEVPLPAETPDEVLGAFGAFVRWFEDTSPIVKSVEEVVYSPLYGYAGTYDALMEINGKAYLVDIKTTNASRQAPQGVYPENFIQLGGYASASKEEFPKKHINGLMVLSVKKDGKLDIVTNEDVSLEVWECADIFHTVLNLHGFLGAIGKTLKERS